MLTLLLGGRWGPRIEEHYGIDSQRIWVLQSAWGH